MLISKLRLKPGDKVRFLDDDFREHDVDMGVSFFTAGKGSIGTVVSDKDDRASDGEPLDEAYVAYLVKLEKVLPPSLLGPFDVQDAGSIARICVKYLEKLDYINPGMIFTLDRIRVILSEDDALLRPEEGYRLLLLDFTIENEEDRPISETLILKASLAYTDAQGDPLVIMATPTISGRVHMSGQVIFQIPEPVYDYKLRLELPGIGAVERDIILQSLQVGDTVLLKYAYADGYDYFMSSRPYDGYPTATFPFFNPSLRFTTKGSYGVLVPFSKFRTAYVRGLKRFDPNIVRINQASIERTCAEVKLGMEEGLAYPVELKEIALPSTDEDKEEKLCREGEIVVIRAIALEKSQVPIQRSIFAIESVRIILPEDDCPLRPELGNKLLQIDFIFEHPDPSLLQSAYPPRLALAYKPLNASRKVITVKPVSLDLPDKELLRGGEFVGKVFFQVPGDSQVYKVSLEWDSIGQWTQAIRLPPLEPGDRVRLVHDFLKDNPHKYPKATAGSVGRIVSFAEYCADYKRLGKEFDQNERIWADNWLDIEYPFHGQKVLDESLEYPVRLEKLLVPSDENVKDLLKEGEIYWMHVSCLEKAE